MSYQVIGPCEVPSLSVAATYWTLLEKPRPLRWCVFLLLPLLWALPQLRPGMFLQRNSHGCALETLLKHSFPKLLRVLLLWEETLGRGPSICTSTVQTCAFYKCFLLRKHFLKSHLYPVIFARYWTGLGFLRGIGWRVFSLYALRAAVQVCSWGSHNKLLWEQHGRCLCDCMGISHWSLSRSIQDYVNREMKNVIFLTVHEVSY